MHRAGLFEQALPRLIQQFVKCRTAIAGAGHGGKGEVQGAEGVTGAILNGALRIVAKAGEYCLGLEYQRGDRIHAFLNCFQSAIGKTRIE